MAMHARKKPSLSSDLNLHNPLTALDARISNTLFRTGTSVPRPVWKCLEYTGDGIVWLVVTAAMLSPTTSPPHRLVWANFFLGLLLDLIEVGLLKGLVRRSRPAYNAIAKDMFVAVAVDHYSFPSGHSSRVSYVALYAIYVAFPHHSAIAVAVALWALIVAMSRCMMGRHYVGDVIAGLLVGVLTMWILTQGTFQSDGLWLSNQMAENAYGLVRKLLGSAFVASVAQ